MSDTPALFFQSVDAEKHKERDFYVSTLKSQIDSVKLAEDPSSANWILLTDLVNLDQFDRIENHELVQKYPEKVLVISESDQPIELWPGLYTSGMRKLTDAKLVNGWFYPYFRVRFPNKTVIETKDPEPLEKKFLASFVGYPSHIIRKKLFKTWKDHPDIFVSVAKGYHHFVDKNKVSAETAQQNYLNTLRASHFSLCPKGRGPASIRQFESMQMGIAPVIISDNWLPPSFIDWESCTIVIKEKQIKDLHNILSSRRDESEEMGQNARKIFLEYFTDDNLGKSVRLALENLSQSVNGNWNPSKFNFGGLSRKRKFRFKLAYYRALWYNAMERIH